jgi:hypothetical protein
MLCTFEMNVSSRWRCQCIHLSARLAGVGALQPSARWWWSNIWVGKSRARTSSSSSPSSCSGALGSGRLAGGSDGRHWSVSSPPQSRPKSSECGSCASRCARIMGSRTASRRGIGLAGLYSPLCAKGWGPVSRMLSSCIMCHSACVMCVRRLCAMCVCRS